MYAAKGMKDINHDGMEFSNSANELKHGIYNSFRSKLGDFYKDLNELFLSVKKSLYYEKLQKLLAAINVDFQERMNSSIKNAGKEILKDVDISTLFNVNRELYSYGKAIMFSVKDYLLNAADAKKI
jgi:phosphate:Na+ symporter